ncbi:MAG: Na+/H+ antiporter subunit E [Actinomyces sp.]|nr:Na+/H+ antiporter subunit E [Actinomyces sp.]
MTASLTSSNPAGPEPHVSRRHTPLGKRLSIAMTLWLTIMWCLIFGHFDWLTIISGVLVALAVQVAFPLPHITRLWHIRPLYVLWVLLTFTRDVIVAGLQVSKVVLLNKRVDNAIVRVDLRSSNPVHLTIQSAMTSLVPGTVVLRVDRLSAGLYLHVLDVPAQGGIDGVKESIRAQEARMLRAIAAGEHLEQWGIDLPVKPIWSWGKKSPTASERCVPVEDTVETTQAQPPLREVTPTGEDHHEEPASGEGTQRNHGDGVRDTVDHAKALRDATQGDISKMVDLTKVVPEEERGLDVTETTKSGEGQGLGDAFASDTAGEPGDTHASGNAEEPGDAYPSDTAGEPGARGEEDQ